MLAVIIMTTENICEMYYFYLHDRSCSRDRGRENASDAIEVEDSKACIRKMVGIGVGNE